MTYLQSISKGNVPAGSESDDEFVTMYETTIITQTATDPAPPAPTPTEDKAAKLREQQAKWAEEERRDRLRREKREQERLARLFEEQDRVTDEDDAMEDSGPQVVNRVTPAAQPDAAQTAETTVEAGSAGEGVAEPVVPMEPEQGDVTAEYIQPTGSAEHAADQSADTPLEAAADDFEHGETEVPAHKHSDQSAVTPLEEEAEEFESGQHEAVWDESPTEERVKDEL